jgi:pimeloyl-ACP methyl ester carboxylesterase
MPTFNFKKIDISYLDQGQGEVIVFLHGFLENKNMWQQTMVAFQKTHRCIAIDLLGHGQTPCLGYIHSMEKQADMILSLLNHLDIKKFHLVGHSMGGYIALAILEKKPRMVQQLVLLNSTSAEDSEERKVNRERAVAAVKQNHLLFIGVAVTNLFSANSQKKLNAIIEKLKIEAQAIPKQGVIAALSGMKIRKDRTFLLAQGTHDILVILGKKDPVLPYESTKALSKLKKVKLVTLTEGHMSWLENPETMQEALIDFIRA